MANIDNTIERVVTAVNELNNAVNDAVKQHLIVDITEVDITQLGGPVRHIYRNVTIMKVLKHERPSVVTGVSGSEVFTMDNKG